MKIQGETILNTWFSRAYCEKAQTWGQSCKGKAASNYRLKVHMHCFRFVQFLGLTIERVLCRFNLRRRSVNTGATTGRAKTPDTV